MFSLNDAEKLFATNSQTIRKQFANSKPATTRLFAEFAEFATFSKSEKQLPFDNELNNDLNQKVGSKLSGLNIRNIFDDRYFCHECNNLLRDGRCFVATQGRMDRASRHYKPCDIVPRRCADFMARVTL